MARRHAPCSSLRSVSGGRAEGEGGARRASARRESACACTAAAQTCRKCGRRRHGLRTSDLGRAVSAHTCSAANEGQVAAGSLAGEALLHKRATNWSSGVCQGLGIVAALSPCTGTFARYLWQIFRYPRFDAAAPAPGGGRWQSKSNPGACACACEQQLYISVRRTSYCEREGGQMLRGHVHGRR
ncbi:hypothetical protein BS50DRAFT_206127 [Corynespora cassiicola Philippines]|uniref:Uncharacterized protein n=1 Tax=Corynespora cassiicola Philippines TaxID=1448308 RepID=A0A2T2N5G6_CORCC|nr:hypothetical protein BS50DRAFT_206127 [Corynespora cassiicola Philippines]